MSTPLSPAPSDALAEQKANFLAVISHELRTPMQSIYGLLELIEQENANPDMRDMIQAAQGSAALMLDLLDDILDFARLDANKLELEQLEVPLRTLVQGVMEAMRARIQRKPIVFNAVIDPAIPTIVLGDPKRLRQILFNLIGNAEKFTAQGKIELRLKFIAGETSTQNRLRIEVEDTGIGIEPDIQKKLFQPFTQGDNSVARHYGGTGLGLSICFRLVKLMGGEIGVTSTPGAGSVFWLDIPCLHAAHDTTEPSVDLSALHVLAVESHPNAAQEIERALRNMGADTVVISTIEDARRQLDDHRFDVLITDYILPDGNGIDFMRDIARAFPRMGLVMYTFYTHDDLIQNLKAIGAIYLGKPASRKGLGQTILDVARRHWIDKENTPQRVLLVEDTASVRDILKRQIERMGVVIDVAVDGMAALDLIKTTRYGLIITDLHMPGIDGYTLADQIRKQEHTSHTPIILLTADIQLIDRAAYLRRGFDDCLNKPVSFQHLRHTLQRWGIETSLPEMPVDSPPSDDLPQKNTPLIDLSEMMHRVESTRVETIQILKSFPSMSQVLMSRIDGTDPHDVMEAAHSLKGAARFACCTALADMCDQIQNDGKNGLIDPQKTKAARDIFTAVCNEIEAL